MKRSLFVYACLLLAVIRSSAQTPVVISSGLHFKIQADTQRMIVNAFDTLLNHINTGKTLSREVNPVDSAISISLFTTFKGLDNGPGKQDDAFYKPQLTNLYPVNQYQYFISVAYIKSNTIRAILNFIANIRQDEVTFAIPLNYLTSKWTAAKVGNITYHYPDNIKLKRAKKFNADNPGLPGSSACSQNTLIFTW